MAKESVTLVRIAAAPTTSKVDLVLPNFEGVRMTIEAGTPMIAAVQGLGILLDIADGVAHTISEQPDARESESHALKLMLGLARGVVASMEGGFPQENAR